MTTTAQIQLLARGRYPARVYTYAIAVVTLAPALILAGYLATSYARLQRAQLEQNAKDQSREVIAAIERDVLAIQNVLMTLADSHFLQTGDLEAFYGQAANVSRQLGVAVILRDAHLEQQVVNTAFPWGTRLVGSTRAPRSEAEEERLRLGKPVVSDVFFGALLNRYVVSIAVPVFRGGDLQYFLSAGISLKRFSALLGSLDIRSGQIVNVIDRNGTFVTRSSRHDDYAGKKARYFLSPDMPRIVKGVGRNGVASHWFMQKSGLLGWTVAIGVGDRVLAAPMTRSLATFAAASIVVLAVAFALAHFWGGRVAQSAGALGIDREPTRDEFQTLFDSAPNGVMVVDDQGRIALANARMEKKFGYSPGDLIGKPVDILVPQRFRSAHARFMRAFMRDMTARPMGAGRDLFGQRKDGTEFPVEIGLNPINSRAGNLIMITVIDISRQKLAAESLAITISERDELRRRLVQAQEQERLRLAHELHDQTGQSLTAIMLEVKAVEDSINEPERARLRLLRARLEQVGQTLHHVAWELRPASINELGLASALANYLAEWSAQYDIETDFHSSDIAIGALSEEVCTTIYRVVQEALTNVVKHARNATSVSVVIDQGNGKVRLTIEDDGCGFDTASFSEHGDRRDGGLGLAGMRERLMLIGADFEVESSVGIGTTIFARIPLESKRSAA